MAMIGPTKTPENVPFWEAANEQRLLIKSCRQCNEHHWYPRKYCPFCGGETHWSEASGEAVLYSYSKVALQDGKVVGYVTLSEGVTLATVIATDDTEQLQIDQPLSVAFVESESGQKIPVFRPVN